MEKIKKLAVQDSIEGSFSLFSSFHTYMCVYVYAYAYVCMYVWIHMWHWSVSHSWLPVFQMFLYQGWRRRLRSSRNLSAPLSHPLTHSPVLGDYVILQLPSLPKKCYGIGQLPATDFHTMSHDKILGQTLSSDTVRVATSGLFDQTQMVV